MILRNPTRTVFRGVLSDFPLGTYFDVKDKTVDSVCATYAEEVEEDDVRDVSILIIGLLNL